MTAVNWIAIYQQQQSRYSSVILFWSSTYVRRKTKYDAAIFSSVDEDGYLIVTFVNICNQDGNLFKLVEKDQIIKIYPLQRAIGCFTNLRI